MKSETPCYENDLTGVVNVKECGIALNAQTFQILSRMYTNPIKSVQQELGCNAWDSQVAAGNNKRKFEVTLPTTDNPLFSIRDFGEGMSKDKIYNVYVDYMSSDKRGTNSQTGYYGLGSKTPFALDYVKSFDVEVYYNGVYTKYRLCLNGQGYPELHEFESHVTDEENGVKISIDNIEDVTSWEYFAKSVYRWFYPCPEVKRQDGSTVEIETVEYDLESDVWKLAKNLNHSYIVMGNVAYEISASKLNRSYHDLRFLDHGLVFYCNIGQLDIVPSRDNLEYSDKTIKKIQDLINNVKTELFDTLRIQMHNRQFKTYLEACLFIKEFKSNHRYLFTSCKEQKLYFNGKVLQFEYLTCPELVRKFYWHEAKIKQEKSAAAIGIFAGNKYYFDDLKVGGVCRIKELMRNSDNHSSVYLLPFTTTMLTFATEVLGIKDVQLTSQLPHKVTKRGSRKNVVKCYKYDHDQNGPRVWRHSNSRYWKEHDIDLNSSEVHYYVKIDRYNTEHNGFKFTINNIKNSAKELGIEIDTNNIYGITDSIVPRIRKKSNWIYLIDYIKAKLQDVDCFSDIQCLDKTFNMLDDAEHITRSYKHSPELFEDCELIVKFYNDYEVLVKEHNDSHKKRSNITQLCRIVDQSYKDENKEGEYNKDIVDLYNRIKERYPLMFFIEPYHMNSEVCGHIANMVKAVDANDKVNANLEYAQYETA